MSSPRSAAPGIAFLGFGEAASAFAAGLSGAGLSGLTAYDVAVHKGSALLTARAEDTGTRLLAGPEGLAGADHVFAMVQPAVAEQAAAMAAPHLGAGTLYVDLSSSSPDRKRAAAATVTAAGARYLDAAIIGSVPASGYKVPVIVSGPEAGAFAATFAPYGMDITPVGDDIGAAAGIKLVRSILAKGMEALYVEALLVADRFGVADRVLDTFCAFLDARPARDTAALLMRSHVIHAGRRADEVRMSRDMVTNAGVAPLLTDATIAVMEQTAATGVADTLGGRQPATLEDALAALIRARNAAARGAGKETVQ